MPSGDSRVSANVHEVDSTLADRSRQLGVVLDTAQRASLRGYVDIMKKWTRTYNLTAVRSDENMLTHHILDSLAVVPHIEGKRLVDVGSGAGLPGIPLAIALPACDVTLVEAVQKKVAFLRQAVIDLGLRNVTVVGTRAFAHLREFISVAGHLCSTGGIIAAMKGIFPQEEIDAIPKGYHVERTVKLDVPGLNAERHLILVKRDG